jgi:hypothetical protein
MARLTSPRVMSDRLEPSEARLGRVGGTSGPNLTDCSWKFTRDRAPVPVRHL